MPLTRLDISIHDADEITLEKDPDLGDLTLSFSVHTEFVFTEPQGEIIYRLLQRHFDGRKKKKAIPATKRAKGRGAQKASAQA
jgi:hypothetical protein